MQEKHLTTPDGTLVAARLYAPANAQTVRGHVVLAPAMATAQRFYAPFAQWLAGRGWQVWTFDYRGMGESLALAGRSTPRGIQADLLDWVQDYAAVVDAAHHAASSAASNAENNAAQGQPLLVLAHSMGGQIAGLLPNAHNISGMLGVACGTGYWRLNAPATKRKIHVLWWVLVPLLTAVFGYFPGRRIGLIGDVLTGAVRQWRRWCLHPRYCMREGQAAEAAYAAVRWPIISIALADDDMLSVDAIRGLLPFYANASTQFECIAPADVGLQHIGHFGAFRASAQATVWPMLEQRLEKLLASSCQDPAHLPSSQP